MLTYLWIGLGGALGSMARYGASRYFALLVGETFPVGTLVVNVSGSLVIGLLAALSGPDGRVIINPDARQFMLVGLCGGYTTFSSFSLQTLALVREGDIFEAGVNIVLSVLLCLIAVWLGAALGAWLNTARTPG